MSELTAAIVQAFQQDVCFEEVSRRDHLEPCDLTAVAVRLDPDNGEPYPVCSRHTRKPLVSMHAINVALDAEEADRG